MSINLTTWAQQATLLKRYLQDTALTIANILPFDLNSNRITHLDLSESNSDLLQIDPEDTERLEEYITSKLLKTSANIGIGGYRENRSWYRRSSLFDSPDGPRTIHLGVDLWVTTHTTIFAPLAGTVHSFNDNANFGDYGPTIILEHQLNELTFYTIYGHLSRSSLEHLAVGQKINLGEAFAEVGSAAENGSWPPHLHFQLTLSMLGNTGDFPGVAAEKNSEFYISLCPDPNLLLRATLLTDM